MTTIDTSTSYYDLTVPELRDFVLQRAREQNIDVKITGFYRKQDYIDVLNGVKPWPLRHQYAARIYPNAAVSSTIQPNESPTQPQDSSIALCYRGQYSPEGGRQMPNPCREHCDKVFSRIFKHIPKTLQLQHAPSRNIAEIDMRLGTIIVELTLGNAMVALSSSGEAKYQQWTLAQASPEVIALIESKRNSPNTIIIRDEEVQATSPTVTTIYNTNQMTQLLCRLIKAYKRNVVILSIRFLAPSAGAITSGPSDWLILSFDGRPENTFFGTNANWVIQSFFEGYNLACTIQFPPIGNKTDAEIDDYIASIK